MKAYIYPSGVQIEPFGDLAAEMPVLSTTFGAYVHEVLAGVFEDVQRVDSLSAIPPHPCFVIADNCFMTRPFVKKLLRLHRKDGRFGQIAIEPGDFTRDKEKLDSFEWRDDAEGRPVAAFPCWFHDGRELQPETLRQAPVFVVPHRSTTFVPDGFRDVEDEGFRLEIIVTHEGILALNHWSRLIEVNHMALLCWWLPRGIGDVLWALCRLLWAFPWTSKYRVLRSFNVIGKGCDIHPSASVEGCILEDGVVIGPNSTVQGSYLCRKSRVGANAHIQGSFLRPEAFVSFMTSVTSSIIMERGISSLPAANVCVIGREARSLSGAYLTDVRLDQKGLREVKVSHKGALTGSGKRFLGSAIGHGSIIGSGLWINSGLSVPNGTMLVRDRLGTVMKLGELEAGNHYSLQEGDVRPYGELYNQRKNS